MKSDNNWHFIYEIKENRRNGRWRYTNFHEREIVGKMKENEENRGINVKNASHNQFIDFFSFTFLSV